MSQPGGRIASLGRNPSAEHMKRRRSWQGQDKPFRNDEVPDVRTMLSPHRVHLPSKGIASRVRCTCSEGSLVQNLVAILGVIALACFLLLVMAISYQSNLVYSKWVVARDGTVYYVNNMNRLQAVILVSVFCATALGIVASYALFSVISRKREERAARRRHLEIYGDLVLRDLEQGNPHHQTKENISKLMNDAEKQYIAEYNRKIGPDDQRPVIGIPKDPPNVISIQRLTEGVPVSNTNRSWSLKRVLSFSRRGDQPYSRADLRPKDYRPPEWVADPNEMAAKLSAPDAFNRASIAHGPPVGHFFPETTQKDIPEAPATPRRGENLSSRKSGPSEDQTRILVTTPIESYPVRNSGSEIDEEEFDRSRQHSVLPHLPGQHPFQAHILESGDFGPGWHEVELENDEKQSLGQSSGHLIAENSSHPSSSSTESVDTLELIPQGSSNPTPENVKGVLEISLEEVLPRPQSGLLNRLLRLAKAETMLDNNQTVFLLKPGKEYMVNFKLYIREDSEMKLGLKWIRVKPADGQAVRFNIEEEMRKEKLWNGSACWDLCMHNSEMLNSEKDLDSGEISAIKILIAAETLERPLKRLHMEGNVLIRMNSTQRQPNSPTTGKRTKTQNTAAFDIV